MSTGTSTWLWEHSVARPLDRLVLLAISDEAGDSGVSDMGPSQRRIAMKTGLSLSGVRRVLTRLEGAGDLLVRRPAVPAPGRYSRYCLVMGRDPATLAEQLGWPPPLLDTDRVREWEQMALEVERKGAQFSSDGYTMHRRTGSVAPYPVEEVRPNSVASSDDGVDEPGDDPVDDEVDNSNRAEPRHPSARGNRAEPRHPSARGPSVPCNSVPKNDASRKTEAPVDKRLTVNEVRALIKRPPIEGGDAPR